MIHNVFRHRAIVRRKQGALWVVILVDLPCLLSASRMQDERVYTSEEQRPRDRSGLLMTAPETELRPNDRVAVTGLGTFVVQPEPSVAHSLTGIHHREYAVRGVS